MAKRAAKSKTPPVAAAAKQDAAFVVRHAWWLIPFGLFLVVRLFSGDPYYLLAGDQCTFLELARTFPRHQLYNHELYLIHSPVFGYAIGLLHLFLPLLASGLVASLAFACLNFFVLRNLALLENLPRTAIFAGLLYLALNRAAVAYDYHVARVSILVCATAWAILALLRLLREPGRRPLFWAIAANCFALLLTDQSLLLLPCQVVIVLARGRWRDRRLALLAAASMVAALVWPAVRVFAFSGRSDLPAGIDGTIEFTRNFPVMALIQPNFLPFTNVHRSLFTGTSLSFANLKLGLLAGLPADFVATPQWLAALVVIALIAAAFVRPERRRNALLWLALSLLFLLPVGLGMNEWYGMGFVVPFSLLMMEGAAAAIVWTSEKACAIGLSAVSALVAVLWLAAPAPGPHSFLSPRGGTYFLFSRPPVTRASAIAQLFDQEPRDTGIMAPTDLSPEIVYLTDKRVVALPFDPALLDRFIDEYRISYLLTSSEFLRRYDSKTADEYTGSLVTRYLFEHPEKYRPVRSLRENYPAYYPSMEYYVFRTGQ